MFNRNTLLSVSLASALMLVGVNGAFADDMASPRQKAEHLKKELNLTDDQTKKVESIFVDSKQKREALHEETRTQLKSVLTDAQMKKLDDMKAERMKDSKKSSY